MKAGGAEINPINSIRSLPVNNFRTQDQLGIQKEEDKLLKSIHNSKAQENSILGGYNRVNLLDIYEPIILDFCRVIPSSQNWPADFEHIRNNMLRLVDNKTDPNEIECAYPAIEIVCCSYETFLQQCINYNNDQQFAKDAALFFSLTSKVFACLVKNTHTLSSDDVYKNNLSSQFDEFANNIKTDSLLEAVKKAEKSFNDAAMALMDLLPYGEC